MLYREVSFDTFAHYAQAAKASRGEQGLCVTIPSEAYMYMLAEDGLSGYAIEYDTICGVFSHASVNGRLPEMIRGALNWLKVLGIETAKLDCFAPLAPIYERFGFQTYETVAFDWAYAPEGWKPENGTPAVHFMALPLVNAQIAAE